MTHRVRDVILSPCQTGDEHVDLGGDAYVAGNIFHRVLKDDETSDRGYANGISTGDAGSGTTIAVARNIFWDVDHAINLIAFALMNGSASLKHHLSSSDHD